MTPPIATPSQQHRRGLARRAATVLALGLAFFVHALNLVHPLVATHRLCPEHGELVDVSPGAGSAGLHQAILSEGRDPAVERSAAAVDTHADDHCLLASHRRMTLAAPLRAELAAACGATIEDPSSSAVVPGAGPSLLRLAPKASPPV